MVAIETYFYKNEVSDIYDIDDIYYSFGEYIYNCLKPEITTDLNMFKYILGKMYLESII